MTTAQRRHRRRILNTKAFTDLVPGSYSVTETLPVTGYDLTDLVCIDGGAGTNTVEHPGDAASPRSRWTPASSVTCTYTNTQQGSITIIKDTVPDGAQDFSLHDRPARTCPAHFTLDDDGAHRHRRRISTPSC